MAELLQMQVIIDHDGAYYRMFTVDRVHYEVEVMDKGCHNRWTLMPASEVPKDVFDLLDIGARS